MKKILYRLANILVYRGAYFLSKILATVLFRIRIIGSNNVPKQGSFIIAPNHASLYDPHIVGCSIRREIYYLARSTLMKNKVLTILFQLWNCIPVDRDKPAASSLKKAVQVLREGKPLMIFPEGTRSVDGELQKGKLGIGFIAQKSQAPIIPVYVHGSYGILPKGAKFPRLKKVTVLIGKPLYFKNLYAQKGNEEIYQAISDEVMNQISILKSHVLKENQKS